MNEILGVSATPSIPYAKYYPADETGFTVIESDQVRDNLYLCIPQFNNGKLNWGSFLYTFANNLAKSGSCVILTKETTGYSGNLKTLAQTVQNACKQWNIISAREPKTSHRPFFHAHKRGECIRIMKVYPSGW